MDYYDWKPYVPVAARRRQAAREAAKLAKKGQRTSPVVIDGRKIAKTFWGKAWCDNLERYSDFANRLPRGRTYVRNGSVVDLQIAPGAVTAMVSGSDLYRIEVKVAAVPKGRWAAVCRDCAGAIDSLVELLQGRFSQGVMTRICQEKTGLFPSPAEIEFTCSCPDWASMCKHVAAVLYGIGARLDEKPDSCSRYVRSISRISSRGRARVWRRLEKDRRSGRSSTPAICRRCSESRWRRPRSHAPRAFARRARCAWSRLVFPSPRRLRRRSRRRSRPRSHSGWRSPNG